MSAKNKYRRLANKRDAAARFNLPQEVKDELIRRGLNNGRSMSAEILNRLIDSLLAEDLEDESKNGKNTSQRKWPAYLGKALS